MRVSPGRNCSSTPLFPRSAEAGEASGALAEILGKVASYFEASVKLSKKVKSAMTYPIAVIGLAIALVNVLLIFVIPVFAAMFADLRQITVAVPTGTMEGAAGSSYYSAPVTIKANRKDDFYIRSAGGVDLCGVGVPVRRKPAGERG